MRPTYLTINTSLVRENLRKIKDSLPEWSTSTAVIKANGYGHGSVMMGRIAVEEGYESLAVAIPEESVPLRNAGIMVPIYLLGLTRPQSFELVADTNSIPAVCESTDLEALDKVAENHDMIIRVAVAVDTGMHRIGIKPEDAVEFIKRVESYENLEVDGFFSHMSNADAADQSHAHGQAQKFHKMVDEIRAFRPDADYRFSLANSAGLLSVKDSLFTDARPGIIQYGIMPSLDVPNRLGLKPVLSFHSEVVHVQHLEAGEGIGYGSTYVTPEPMTIATIPVGYADGYPRSLSNRGTVLIHGRLWPWTNFSAMSESFPDPLGVGSTLSLGLAVFAEVFCSVGFIFGAFYRLAMIPMVFTMGMAFFVIHGNDPFAVKELAFIYLVVFVLMYITGPGKFSIDHVISSALYKKKR